MCEVDATDRRCDGNPDASCSGMADDDTDAKLSADASTIASTRVFGCLMAVVVGVWIRLDPVHHMSKNTIVCF